MDELAFRRKALQIAAALITWQFVIPSINSKRYFVFMTATAENPVHASMLSQTEVKP
jgi:hypothetical protein